MQAARNITTLNTPLVRSERYFGWRRAVEAFKAVTGVRPLLMHLPDAVWARRFAANQDAFEAVVDELAGVES